VPEGIEIEFYRQLAERALGRVVRAVDAPDAWFLKGGLTPAGLVGAVQGRTLTGARRVGKLLLLDTDGPTIGLRFGMTGRLVVDGIAGVEQLEYSSRRDDRAWDRVVLHLDRGDLRVNDPRRLGGVVLDPDEAALGHDLRTLTVAQLRDVLHGSTAPLKARLLDQARIAGIGNLIADEVLWRAGLDPAREARSLDGRELRRLQRHVRSAVDEMVARGGSHTGDLFDARRPGGRCPKDGTPLVRRTIGGRTTWSCPRHQR